MVFFLLFQQDRNPDFMDLTEGELESKSKLAFEKCLDCRKERSSIGWCKDCEINAFNQLDFVKNVNKGGTFSSIYSAIWMEGP